jgi:hypothetical protein
LGKADPRHDPDIEEFLDVALKLNESNRATAVDIDHPDPALSLLPILRDRHSTENGRLPDLGIAHVRVGPVKG